MNKNSKSLEKVLREGKVYLKDHGILGAALDAEVLLMDVLNKSKIQLFTHSKELIDVQHQTEYNNLLKKRVEGVPTQYLVGRQEFMGLPFCVNEQVLIPRPDTEILVETVLKYVQKENMKVLMDIGTGSGCIPISLCWHCQDIRMIALDISEEALKVAKKNADSNEVSKRIGWIQGDLFQKVPNEVLGFIDAIVSNPPYIPTRNIEELMREVREHEPFQALDGGEDGLCFYRKIIQSGKAYIKPSGYIFFEVGHDQADAVRNLMEQQGFIEVKICKDLAGIDRVVYGKKSE